MDIFTALESMDDKGTINDVDITNVLLEIVDDSDKISTLDAQFAEFIQMDDYIDQSITSVEALISTIEKNGICKSTVMVADPFGEFQSRSILPQVSDLNDVPTNDQNSTAAVEGLKEVAKKFWDAIKNFFKKIKDFVVTLFRKFTNVFLSFAKIGEKYKKIFEKAGSFDAEKLKKQSVPFVNDAIQKIIYGDKEYVNSMAKSMPKIATLGFGIAQKAIDGLEGKDNITKENIAEIRTKYVALTVDIENSMAKGTKLEPLYGITVKGSTYDDLKIETDTSAIAINKPSDTNLDKLLKSPGDAVEFCKYLISAGTLIKVNDTFSKQYTKASDSVIKVAEKLGGSEVTANSKELIGVAKKILKTTLALSKASTALTIKSCKMIVPVLTKASTCIKK